MGPAFLPPSLHTKDSPPVSSPNTTPRARDLEAGLGTRLLTARPWVYYSLRARICNCVLGIHCSLPTLPPSREGHAGQALTHQQNAATLRPRFCPGKPCKDPVPGVWGRASRIGTLCLVLTRISDSQKESQCSAELLCFSEQSKHRGHSYPLGKGRNPQEL